MTDAVRRLTTVHVEVSRQVAPVTLALAKLETRMETKFEGMETKFEGIDARFEVLEGLVRELGQGTSANDPSAFSHFNSCSLTQ